MACAGYELFATEHTAEAMRNEGIAVRLNPSAPRRAPASPPLPPIPPPWNCK